MKPVYDEEEKQSHDTEITLGMSSLLGIFFGAVLICGVFFGFGYSMGRGNARTAAPAKVTLGDSTNSASSNPATAGRLSSTTPPVTAPPVSAPEAPASQAPLKTVVAPTEDSPTRESSAADTAENPPAQPLANPKNSPAVAAKTQPAPPPPNAAAPPTPTGPPVMVQIAAVANQEDANILVSALKKHGYQVSVRSEPADKFLHIQLGPFASRDEAKAMRTKLLADGYNAILK